MANFFRRPMEDNEWRPIVCEIDFTDKMLKKIGELATQGEVWTAWITLDEVEEPYMPEVTFQITQENCRVISSDLDDDADAVQVLDPRDNLWFRYARVSTDPDVFEWCAVTVMPWAVRISSMAPLEEHYKPIIKLMSRDVDDFQIPDTWLNGDNGV